MSEKRYQIWAGGIQAPHQDIATLFYTRCAELYAKPQANIVMVIYITLSSGPAQPGGQPCQKGIFAPEGK